MALPSRPLSGGTPATPSVPKAPQEDFELPDIDFSNDSKPTEDFALPEPDLSFEEFLNEPSAVPKRATVNEFTEDFEQAPALAEEPLPELDFDSMFNDIDATSSEVNEELPNELPGVLPDTLPEELPEDPYEDDFDSLFDEPVNPSDDSLPETDSPVETLPLDEDELNKLFDDELPDNSEAPEDNSSSEVAPSWDQDFDRFMDDIEDGADKDETNPTEVLSEDPEDDPNYVSTFDEDEDNEQEPAGENRGNNRSPRSGGPRGVWGKFSSSLLKNLGSLPLIGRIFKPLEAIAGVFTAILALIPLLAIPVIIYFIASAAVPSGNTATGPDGGAVSISDFSYSNGEVTGELTNTGDIIANVMPSYNVWSYDPFGGGSLFAFDKVTTCEGDEITADIDETVEVKFACASDASGLAVKASGTIAF